MDELVVATDSSYSRQLAEKLACGELVFRRQNGKSRLWCVFARLEDRNGVEVNGYVCCLQCKSIYKYTSSSSSNLVKHKCYVYRFVHKQEKPISIIEIETPKIETFSTNSGSDDELVNPLDCNDESNFESNENNDLYNNDAKIDIYNDDEHDDIYNNEENNDIYSNQSNDNNDGNNYLSKDNKNLTKLIAECCVKYCRSYDVMKDNGLKAIFQEFLAFGAKFGHSIDVNKILPNSEKVVKNLAEIYDYCFQRVKLEISKIKEKGFGVATAIWTDDISKKHYLAVTIHFFKNETLKYRMLGLRLVEGEKYTSQSITAIVEDILKDFDLQLSRKSIIVTTENCDNFNKLPQDIKKISSISHLLKNSLQKVTDEVVEVAELIRACEKLVDFCKKSEPNTILSRSLNSYCPIRSNTVYKMLSSIENNWSLITQILGDKNEAEQLSNIKTNHLRALIRTLQPFEEAIEALVDDNTPTQHLVFVYLHELKKFCATDYGRLDFIKSLKNKLQSHLHVIETHNIATIHKLAVFLYPPANKMLQFSDEDKQFIKDECIRLMKCLKDENKSNVQQEVETTNATQFKQDKLFSDFIANNASCDPNELIIQELDFYKNTRVLNSEDFDVFQWWEIQKNNFPLLYQLSYSVLTTPASSATSQKILATASSMLCEKVLDSSSKELTVEQIMFVNSNAETERNTPNQLYFGADISVDFKSICQFFLEIISENTAYNLWVVGSDGSYTSQLAEKLASGELVFRRKKGKSRVWNIFAKLVDQNGVEITGYVCCIRCKTIYKFTCRSTSNLMRHKCYTNSFLSKIENPISIVELETPKIETFSTNSGSDDELVNPLDCNDESNFESNENNDLYNNDAKNDINNDDENDDIYNNEENNDIHSNQSNDKNDGNNYLSKDNKNLTKLIAECCMEYCRSLDIVKDDGLKAIFQEFLALGAKFGHSIDVNKILPSSEIVAKNLAEIYEKCFQRVKLEISKIKEKGFGIATAIWTDDILKKHYLAVTIHFFKNRTLKFRLLGLRLVEGEKYTSQSITAIVEDILKDFDLKLSRKSIIVTTENCDNFKKLPQDIKKISSISHLLKNSLQKVTDEVVEVAELIRACEKLVDFCKKSEPNTILSRSLNSYCPIRSNTAYKMLSSIENNWNLITQILGDKNEAEQLSNIKTNHLRALMKTLQPFEEAIEALVNNNTPTQHLVFVYLHELKKFCATDYGRLDFIKSLKNKLQSHLHVIETHNIATIHKLAVFLYPPANKMLQFSDEDKQFIKDECIRLMKCLKDENKSNVKQELKTTNSTLFKHEKLFSDFIENDVSVGPNELIIHELDYYKNTRVLNSEDFDVFLWWEVHKNNFPLLYQLSYSVLTTPASSATPQKILASASSMFCENVFDSISKELMVEQVMFLNSNEEIESDFKM